MPGFAAVIAQFPGLRLEELSLWVERRWVCPLPGESGESGEPDFAEIDLARVGLIVELRATFEVNDDLMPVVLSLLDQLYAERRRLGAVLAAVEEQAAEVRQAVRAALSRAR